MSAFLVEDQTINKIVARLNQDMLTDSWLQSKLEGLGYFDGDGDTLAQDMFDLNCEALRQRYNDTDCRAFTFQIVTPDNLIQSLKHLECWLYQCLEGNVPEHSLYHFFNEVYQPYLNRVIVHSLPEWIASDWR